LLLVISQNLRNIDTHHLRMDHATCSIQLLPRWKNSVVFLQVFAMRFRCVLASICDAK